VRGLDDIEIKTVLGNMCAILNLNFKKHMPENQQAISVEWFCFTAKSKSSRTKRRYELNEYTKST